MAVKIPESTLPTRDLEPGDYIRVVGSDGRSAKIPRTGIDGLNVEFQIDSALSNISENPVQNKVINSVLESNSSDINALKSELTVQTDSYTINGVTFEFEKYGRVIVVMSSGTPTVAVPTNAYAGSEQLDPKYKPIVSYNAKVAATGSTNMQVSITANTNTFQYGYAGTQIPTTTNIRCTFAYISYN